MANLPQPPKAPQPTQAAPKPPQTFAQMQQQGVARPAQPAQPAYAGQANQAISQSLAKPSAYDNEAVQSQWQRMAGQIDDEFKQKDTGLREELARRGLGNTNDSSIGLGRTADLNVAKRSAQVDLAERLATTQAQTMGADRDRAIQTALAGMGQHQTGALAERGFGLQERGLDQQGQLQREGYGLQRELQSGQLGFAREELGTQAGLRRTDQDIAREDNALRARLQREGYDLQRYGMDQNAGLDRDRLGLDRDRLASDNSNTAAQLALQGELGRGGLSMDQQRLSFERQNADVNRQHQAGMQGNELSVQKQAQRNQLMAVVLNSIMNPGAGQTVNTAEYNRLMSMLGFGPGGSAGGGTGTPEPDPYTPPAPGSPGTTSPTRPGIPGGPEVNPAPLDMMQLSRLFG